MRNSLTPIRDEVGFEISGFLKKQKINLFFLHTDCCEQVAAVAFEYEPRFKM